MTWAPVKVSEIVFSLEALRLGHAGASKDMFISLLYTSASTYHVWRCYGAERAIAFNEVIQQLGGKELSFGAFNVGTKNNLENS